MDDALIRKESTIYVAGHTGLVGSAIVRRLLKEGHENLILKKRNELNLLDQTEVQHFFKTHSIDFVFLAAARVGGIIANQTYIADFLYENLMIAANVIHAAANYGVKKFLYLGSSCIYPKFAEQPIRETSLLSGPLEPTNEGYAIAKIAGLKLCEMYQKQYGKCFISVMPTNLYGPGDNFHPDHSHVLPGLLRRFHEAKISEQREVKVWGTGKPRRELLHVDDLADALYLLMNRYSRPEPINVGTGTDISIGDLAEVVKRVVGYSGEICFDTSKPDGTPRKVLDVSKVTSMGWKPSYGLEDGIRETYRWALANRAL